jgi:hypothetical protein
VIMRAWSDSEKRLSGVRKIAEALARVVA